MSDHSAEILELAQQEGDCPECGGKGIVEPQIKPVKAVRPDTCGECLGISQVPLIHTSDGRTLRKPCSECLPDSEHSEFDAKLGKVLIWHTAYGRLRPQSHCAVCCGRGWLPVGEDTAVVVILDWLLATFTDIRFYDFTKVSPGNMPVRIYKGPWPDVVQIGKGDDIFAAVFAAAKEVSDER